jgi:hypothetical protein
MEIEMLKGKLVMMNSPDAYRTGVVVDASAEFALVRFDDMIGAGNDSTLPMELVCLHEMAHAMDDGIRVWGVFNTRDELDAFMSWLEGVHEKKSPKLVPIK